MQDHFTVTELAQLLNVDNETVRKWVRKGELRTERKSKNRGSPIRISKNELICFLRSNRRYSNVLAALTIESADPISYYQLVKKNEELRKRIQQLEYENECFKKATTIVVNALKGP